MKIKRKVEMNLPQLIEWLLKSGYRNYTANSNMGNAVTLSRYGAIQFSHGIFFPEETFAVEVEEEITEDTVIPKMLLRGRYTGYYEVEDCKLRGFNENLLQAYILNDDLTMTLIWRDGKLVE